MFSETTHEVTVEVTPHYLDDQSSPEDGRYLWAYHVRITNHRQDRVQVLRRHWLITDNLGRRQEVEGAGVVGEQPLLAPGDTFEYTSATPLPTPSGIMLGTYLLEAEDGAQFKVTIPAFSLDSPHDDAQMH